MVSESPSRMASESASRNAEESAPRIDAESVSLNAFESAILLISNQFLPAVEKINAFWRL
jgi:hypothetical protein